MDSPRAQAARAAVALFAESELDAIERKLDTIRHPRQLPLPGGRASFRPPVSADELRELHTRYERWLDMVFRELRDVRGLLRTAEEKRQAERTAREGFSKYVPLLARNFAKLRGAAGQAEVNSTQLHVLIFLLSHADEHNWPSMPLSEVGAAAGVRQRAARNAISALESRGLLKRIASSGRCTTFDLSGLIAELERIAEAERVANAASRSPEPVTVAQASLELKRIAAEVQRFIDKSPSDAAAVGQMEFELNGPKASVIKRSWISQKALELVNEHIAKSSGAGSSAL
jgi:DNA-binding MarR family transcriptional regulator